jgi:hypothetical protein
VADAARLLGRLYDAVDCCNLRSRCWSRSTPTAGCRCSTAWRGPTIRPSAMVAALLASNRQCALQALMVCSLQ